MLYTINKLLLLLLLLLFTVKQCLLWATCTGRHWLIALQITIGSNY